MDGCASKGGNVQNLKFILRRIIRLRNYCTIRQTDHEVGPVVRLISVVTRPKIM